MRRLLVLPFLILAWSSTVHAQDPQPERPTYGVDYEFERVRTPLVLNDAFDRGTVDLYSSVYRPKKASSGRVVVILHGSTGHLARSPKEPAGNRPPWLGQLLDRGDTVVIPLRRGRGESGGTYIEECAFHAKQCSLAEINRDAEVALQDALASTRAVIEGYVLPQLKPMDGKVALWGLSRGGFLSLAYAGKHPEQVSEVVAISPGWLSVSPSWGERINAERLEMHRRWFAQAASRFRGEALWIDGATDRYYRTDVTDAFYSAWRDNGGKGVRKVIPAQGHGPTVSSWQAELDAFLARRRL